VLHCRDLIVVIGRKVVIHRALDVTMKAMEVSEQLGSLDVLVQTEWSFISTGTELANFTGRDRGVYIPDSWNSYPYIPGYANCGRVLRCGSNVTEIEVGQRVFSMAKHVSHHLLSTDDPDCVVVPVPEDMAGDVAAAVRMGLVSITALQTADFDLNDYVAVLGLGLVGNLAAQLFALSGARVIGVDPVGSRRALARRVGIEHVTGGDMELIESQLRDLSGGGVRVVVDAVGHAAIAASAIRSVKPYGEVVLLGSPREEYTADLNNFLAPVHYQWVTIKGALEHRIPRNSGRGIQRSVASNVATVLDLLRSERLQLEELISHRMPAFQIGRAYDGLLNDPDTYWGVALDWTDAPD
jgi:2-desacetyl-2-hydroxyethyl bacteriochlorophyllide A dehydrogenase